MTETKLIPMNEKSFYGKAYVITDGNQISLRSYNTIVAVYNLGTQTLKINGYYSMTTARHINAFAVQCGFPTMCKAEMTEEPTLTK